MSNLIRTSLVDLIEFQRGYDLPKSQMIKGKYPVQSSNGILGYHNEYKVKGPGITIGRSGTVGLPHLINSNFFPHNTTLYIKDFKGNDVEYIFYLLKYLKLGDMKSGSGVPTMNRNHLHPLKILAYRNFKTQQSIAKVLSDLDSKIELNNKINKELESMAKTLYDYWFVQFDFPNEEGKPYKSSGGKMAYNAELKREIPEDWELKSLFKSCNVQYGYAFNTDFFNDEYCGVPVIRIRDILENTISAYSTEPNIEDKYKINKGELLIGMDGNFHINYWSKEGCYLNQRVVKLKETTLPTMYIKYQIEPFILLREKTVSRTTVGHLSDKDLKTINVIHPSNNILKKASPFFNSTIKEIIQLQNESYKLAELRDWLLPMLMNGQVKVKDVEHQ